MLGTRALQCDSLRSARSLCSVHSLASRTRFWMLVGQSYTNGYGTKVANSEGPCPHTLSSIQIYARGFRGFTLDYSQSPTTADPSFWREQEPDAEPGSEEYYANQTWKSDWGRRRDLNVLEAHLVEAHGR